MRLRTPSRVWSRICIKAHPIIQGAPYIVCSILLCSRSLSCSLFSGGSNGSILAYNLEGHLCFNLFVEFDSCHIGAYHLHRLLHIDNLAVNFMTESCQCLCNLGRTYRAINCAVGTCLGCNHQFQTLDCLGGCLGLRLGGCNLMGTLLQILFQLLKSGIRGDDAFPLGMR